MSSVLLQEDYLDKGSFLPSVSSGGQSTHLTLRCPQESTTCSRTSSAEEIRASELAFLHYIRDLHRFGSARVLGDSSDDSAQGS